MASDSQIASVHQSKGAGGGEDLNLPTGYRFWPEENELISHYLTNKLLGHPLSANIIHYIDLYEYDPHQLPIDQFKYGMGKEAYYFANTRPNRTTKNGYWKAIGEEEQVFGVDGAEIVGFKKTLNFHWGLEPKGEKQPWIMEEYRLNPSLIPADALSDSMTQKMERLVVCRIQNEEDGGSKSSAIKFIASDIGGN